MRYKDISSKIAKLTIMGKPKLQACYCTLLIGRVIYIEKDEPTYI